MVCTGKHQPAFPLKCPCFQNFLNFFSQSVPAQKQIRTSIPDQAQTLKAVGISDFLSIDVPAREMLLSPILPERSLAMLYAQNPAARAGFFHVLAARALCATPISD
jgi:hypothetical protein